MQETRRLRLQAVILEEMSVVVRELKDPRIPIITFTSCEVTKDGSQATVFVSILGGSKATYDERIPELSDKAARHRMKECLAGLTSASGYLKRHMAKAIEIKQIPNLIFKEDKGLENSNRVHELLKQLDPKPTSSAVTTGDDSSDETD